MTELDAVQRGANLGCNRFAIHAAVPDGLAGAPIGLQGDGAAALDEAQSKRLAFAFDDERQSRVSKGDNALAGEAHRLCCA